jgi:hypothetical protein
MHSQMLRSSKLGRKPARASLRRMPRQNEAENDRRHWSDRATTGGRSQKGWSYHAGRPVLAFCFCLDDRFAFGAKRPQCRTSSGENTRFCRPGCHHRRSVNDPFRARRSLSFAVLDPNDRIMQAYMHDACFCPRPSSLSRFLFLYYVLEMQLECTPVTKPVMILLFTSLSGNARSHQINTLLQHTITSPAIIDGLQLNRGK